MSTVRYEQMGEHFAKYHLNDGTAPWPFHPVLHHFTAPDLGQPHDHPWGFTSHVLSGGYVEEVFRVCGCQNRRRGCARGWHSEIVKRLPGTAHRVEATHIHRIIELPAGECWTLVLADSATRDAHFWRFDEDGIASRPWFRPEFDPLRRAS